MVTKTRGKPRIALALAGGGPLGAIYEIGALCALDEALQGLRLDALDHYVGVSAGSFIAAALANGLTPRELCASFIEDGGGPDAFDPAWLMVPAYAEFLRRGALLPSLAARAAWRSAVLRKPLSYALEPLSQALPTGVFSNEKAQRKLAALFSRAGRSNDFRRLRARLTVVATRLDTGEAVPFGSPGLDHVPVSRAVQASSALPGLFPPVDIHGQWYVDGALRKTLHASVALDEGADLLLCVNPLVPFQTPAGLAGIATGGLPAVLAQTFRSLIHSRLALGMQHYERAYPGADIVLVEPDPGDEQLWRANTFSYRQRRQLAEHAYRQTRALLWARREALGAKLARHGVALREDVLQEPRTLLAPAGPRRRLGAVLGDLRQSLDALEHRLAAPARAA